MPPLLSLGLNIHQTTAAQAEFITATTREISVSIASTFEIDPLLRFGGGGPNFCFPDPFRGSKRVLFEALMQADEALVHGAYLGPADRGARFRCVIALAGPGRATQLFEATTEGQLTGVYAIRSPTYEHYFVPDGESVSFDRLSPARQRAYSHRGKAIEMLSAYFH